MLTENAIERISAIYQEYSESSDYDRGIFSKLWGGIKNADTIVNIVDKYDVTTFNEFYCALLEEYPNLKDEINQTFQTSYRTKGSNDGNVIVYQ